MANQARVLPFGGRRQVLPTLDLRSPEERRGLTESQRNIQAITRILQTIGQAEKVRRDRQTLDRVATAIAGGASTIEAITAVAQQQPQGGTGFQGLLQKIGGAFQPQGGGGTRQNILQMIIGEKLKQALAPPAKPTIAEQRAAEARRTKAVPGTPEFERIAEGPAKPVKRKAFSLTEQKTLSKAIPPILDEMAKQVERTPIKGRNKWAQVDLIEPYKKAALEVGYETWTEDQQKQFDRKWDRLARAKFIPRKTISKETGKQIQIGWNPNSPEVKQARKELRAGTVGVAKTQVPDDTSPPGLEDVWDTLSDEEKETAKRALAAGRTVDEIKALL